MVEDLRHLEVLDGLAREIMYVCNHYNREANGKTDKAELVALRIKQNDELMELLRQQRRALDFMAGKKVDPEVQFGEGVLTGIGGVGP